MQLVQKYYYNFFPQPTFPPICSYLVIPKDVLGPCYACFELVMGIRNM
jgi:hypothetical protein